MSFSCVDRSLIALPRAYLRKGIRRLSEFIVSFLSSSSSTTPTKKWTYDIFLSFGKDTRKNFVDHLYAALDQAGIHTFKDDKKLPKMKTIPLELTKAIQESMIVVVVFSKDYANSTWCLNELADIIQCQNTTTGQKVLPVFYYVDPSDVREQKGIFHAAFEKHELKFENDMEKVKRWREALETAANISGWDVSKTASGCEAECIKRIVQEILCYMESRV